MSLNRSSLRRRVWLGVVATALVTAGCGGSDGSDLAEGTTVATDGGAATADGADLSVTVPTGTFDFVVGEPTDTVGDQSAPSGGSLIRITTSYDDAQVRNDVWQLAARRHTARPVKLTLDVDGTSYPVGIIRRGGRAGDANADLAPPDLVVAVGTSPDQIDDVALGVGYDGLVQTVHVDGGRDSGPADALYEHTPRVSSLPSTSCADGSTDDRAVTLRGFRCRVGVVRDLPYVPGAGWAEDGHTWRVVSLGAASAGAEARGAGGTGRYAVARVADHTTLDGARPTRVLDRSGSGGGASFTEQLVFDADATGPAGVLDIRLGYRLHLMSSSGGSPPAARDVHYATSVDLGRALGGA